MQRKKILWLVSWYPNKNDRFLGDFIQRHARAAAICHDVHVIFVTDADMEKPTDEEWNYATGLTEQIIYFKKKKGIASRLRKQIAWKNTYQQAVKNYIKKNGLPAWVHVHIPWKAGLIALWMKKKYGSSFMITEHWGFYNRTSKNNFFTKPQLLQKLVKEIFKKAVSFVSVSKFLANEVKNATGRNCNVIIPNVVDTSLFFHKNEKYSRFTFIHVSNMAGWKNVDKILQAFAKLIHEKGNQAQLIFIGNRDDKYIMMARQMGLLNEGIFFRNEISYKNVAEEIRRCHCHVLFGNFETFSCVTAEALCSGVPVIVPSAGAVTELVNKQNGLIVCKDEINELSSAMMEMIDTYQQFDPVSISAEASRKFSYSTVAKQFDELYNSVY